MSDFHVHATERPRTDPQALSVIFALDVSFDTYLVRAYIIGAVASTGYFGAKHRDKTQLGLFVFGSLLWFLFMFLETVRLSASFL